MLHRQDGLNVPSPKLHAHVQTPFCGSLDFGSLVKKDGWFPRPKKVAAKKTVIKLLKTAIQTIPKPFETTKKACGLHPTSVHGACVLEKETAPTWLSKDKGRQASVGLGGNIAVSLKDGLFFGSRTSHTIPTAWNMGILQKKERYVKHCKTDL